MKAVTKMTTNTRSASYKEPVYDVLGYTTNLAVKMTAFVNPNHMVIGQQIYDTLDESQKSEFQLIDINPSNLELR